MRKTVRFFHKVYHASFMAFLLLKHISEMRYIYDLRVYKFPSQGIEVEQRLAPSNANSFQVSHPKPGLSLKAKTFVLEERTELKVKTEFHKCVNATKSTDGKKDFEKKRDSHFRRSVLSLFPWFVMA